MSKRARNLMLTIVCQILFVSEKKFSVRLRQCHTATAQKNNMSNIWFWNFMLEDYLIYSSLQPCLQDTRRKLASSWCLQWSANFPNGKHREGRHSEQNQVYWWLDIFLDYFLANLTATGEFLQVPTKKKDNLINISLFYIIFETSNYWNI